ncbi:hypothetical protein [Streptomyces sp. H27-C3]|uniref:hypothetical protein n=1 Tax=Streptomyces sp. H27-C3 TaxID=3046305 RepID=UPI0024BA187A|nr:hypothetical protein [Streptomyces sp. H27-C3]MDJ0461821.1 hypothetical protein [Streptomyces sp. H27-C3]
MENPLGDPVDRIDRGLIADREVDELSEALLVARQERVVVTDGKGACGVLHPQQVPAGPW